MNCQLMFFSTFKTGITEENLFCRIIIWWKKWWPKTYVPELVHVECSLNGALIALNESYNKDFLFI